LNGVRGLEAICTLEPHVFGLQSACAGMNSTKTCRRPEACAQQAVFVPVTVVGDQTLPEGSRSDVEPFAAGRIEIKIAGLTVIGSVAPELAQAVVAALRGRLRSEFR